MSTKALAVVPPTCPISAAGGKSQHQLINQAAARLAFKVKSTNNSNYTVNPNMGFIEIGCKVNMEITRIAGKPKADRLIILFDMVDANETDYLKPFKPGAKHTELYGEFTVKLSAAE
uniref:MSP domain-containing protein n=1 Tax=Setaria digitata TaxID=48799 RepID=A0A915PUA6_9BILA